MTRGDFPLQLADSERHIAEWEWRKAALLNFVADLEDGRQITVGVACAPDKLDPARGTFLVRCVSGRRRRSFAPASNSTARCSRPTAR